VDLWAPRVACPQRCKAAASCIHCPLLEAAHCRRYCGALLDTAAKDWMPSSESAVSTCTVGSATSATADTPALQNNGWYMKNMRPERCTSQASTIHPTIFIRTWRKTLPSGTWCNLQALRNCCSVRGDSSPLPSPHDRQPHAPVQATMPRALQHPRDLCQCFCTTKAHTTSPLHAGHPS
jgi:hypothetical protein